MPSEGFFTCRCSIQVKRELQTPRCEFLARWSLLYTEQSYLREAEDSRGDMSATSCKWSHSPVNSCWCNETTTAPQRFRKQIIWWPFETWFLAVVWKLFMRPPGRSIVNWIKENQGSTRKSGPTTEVFVTTAGVDMAKARALMETWVYRPHTQTTYISVPRIWERGSSRVMGAETD